MLFYVSNQLAQFDLLCPVSLHLLHFLVGFGDSESTFITGFGTVGLGQLSLLVYSKGQLPDTNIVVSVHLTLFVGITVGSISVSIVDPVFKMSMEP